MKKTTGGQLIYSPSDLVRYLASPFASWMDRYNLEHPGAVTPDETSAEDKLIAETGQAHEQTVLAERRQHVVVEPDAGIDNSLPGAIEIDLDEHLRLVRLALNSR